MADKKYYWLKLRNNFFDSRPLKKLRKIAGGEVYTIIYLKLQLLSLKDEGKLFYEGVDDTFIDELALAIDEDVENVKVAVNYFERCGLIEKINSNEMLMSDVPKNIGKEGGSAHRVRDYREKQKEIALQCNADVTTCNADVTKCNTEIEIDIEKELDTDTDIDIEIKKEKEPKTKKEEPPAAYFESEKLNAAFNDFLEMRKTMKPKMTERAKELAVNKLKKLAAIPFSDDFDEDLAVEILNQSTMGSWKGLFPLKNEDPKKDKIANRVSEVDTWV